jgi:sec-independent protein translocase protein TatC
MQNKNLTLTNHLIELRQRLFYCALSIIICFLASYYFAESIYNFLLQPLSDIYGEKGGKRVIYTNLTEGFITYIKLSFISALFFSFPVIALQLYLFIAPALYKKEQKFTLLILIFCPLLFFIGTILVYYGVLPLAFEFFLSFQNLDSSNLMNIELEAKISEYLSLVTRLIFAFGIAFQLPLILIFLVKFGILSVDSLQKKRKYWIVIIFSIAAVITPPDVISQITLALPMILLYEIALIIAKRINPSNQQQKDNYDKRSK